MINRFFTNFVAKFKALSPTSQGFIILSILLAVGIIIRWKYIIDEIMRGFNFFNR
ncbi:MAG: hypothetical protein RSC28_00980 [Bacteroidales bacterium]